MPNLLARHNSENAAKYFGGAVAALVVLCAIIHWTAVCVNRSPRLRQRAAGLKRSLSQPIVKWGALAAYSVWPGRFGLAIAYLAINVSIAFTNNIWVPWTLFAKRLAWMTLCNIVMTAFLALKNTPLSPLAGKSYESVNILHRTCGYVTILFMILHSTIHVAGDVELGSSETLEIYQQRCGAAAGVVLLTMLFTTSPIMRRWNYELFYVLHMLSICAVIILVTYHIIGVRNRFWVLLVAICFIVSDRLLRWTRWIYYAFNNSASLTPLPGGVTKVVLRRSMRAAPGSHAFLAIPAVKLFQTHPFTLVKNDPMTFLIGSQDGFTRHLHDRALKDAVGRRFRASVEGPYGHVPNVGVYDKVVLIAGGTGITFAMALALAWVQKRSTSGGGRTLDFVWVVRDKAYTSWFSTELSELQKHDGLSLRIHVTSTGTDKNVETASQSPASSDVEKGAYGHTSSLDGTSPDQNIVESGRPLVREVLGNAIRLMSAKQNVLVAVCGPHSLTEDARASVLGLVTPDSPSVTLHTERFGW